MSEPGSSPQRVLMVVHGYYPLDPRVRREALAARDGGWQVAVLCLKAAGESAREEVEGVEVRRLPLQHVSGGGTRRMLLEYVAFTLLATLLLIAPALRRRYEVIHVNNPPDFLVLCGLLPRLLGARLLLDIHDLSSHMFRARFTGMTAKLAGAVLERGERLAAAVCDEVITVHEPYRRELAGNGVPEQKITLVMNSLDPRFAEGIPRRTGRRSNGAFTVAYTGTVNHWYGVDLVLDAIQEIRQEIPDAHGLVLGRGDAVAELQARVRRERMDAYVELPGTWVPIEQVLERLVMADCGVIPNRPTELNRFALSTKLFEYLAIGLPVVVAELETLAAHFSAQEVTFFTPGDASSLARALRWVASHPSEAAAKTQRAHARVAREYSWDLQRSRYLRVLAGGGRREGSLSYAASRTLETTSSISHT